MIATAALTRRTMASASRRCACVLAPGANAVKTSAAVQAALDELQTRFPAGLKARVFYDSSTFVAATDTRPRYSRIICWADGGGAERRLMLR